MARLIISLLLLAPLLCKAECEHISKRSVSGREPLASKLYGAAQSMELGAWKAGTFHTEQFDFLGTLQVLGKPVHVAYLSTIWGPSCRATYRLLFFTAKLKPMGQYYGISKPSLKGNTLVFHPTEGGTSTVDMASGLPAKINGGDDFFALEGQP